MEKEDQLWKTMLDGDETAFSKIYQEYAYRLLAYGSKIAFDETIVKDAIQDVFVRLWKNRKTISAVSNVQVYLFKSLRNRLYKILELEKKYETALLDEKIQVGVLSIEDAMILSEFKKEQLLKLHHYLQKLPTHQREAIHLRFFQNLQITEIAALMEVNNQSVSNSIYRGLNTLRFKFRPTKLSTISKKTDQQ